MNKVQFWILNIIGFICGGLILSNLYLAHRNEKSDLSIRQTREQVAYAQELQNRFQNLAVRVAQLGREEVGLSNLLVRHDLKVNLNQAIPPGNPAANPQPPTKTAP